VPWFLPGGPQGAPVDLGQGQCCGAVASGEPPRTCECNTSQSPARKNTDTVQVSPNNNTQPWWAPESDIKPARVYSNTRKRIIFAVGAVAAGVLLIAAAFTSPQDRSRQISPGIIEESPSLDSLVASCTGVVNWERPEEMLSRLPWEKGAVSVEDQILDAIAEDAPVRLGFYSPGDRNIPSTSDIAAYISNGGYVIWYSTNESGDGAISGLKSILGILSEEGLDYVALPWPESKEKQKPTFSRTDSGGRILYMRWGATQSCAVASDVVISDFVKTTTKQ